MSAYNPHPPVVDSSYYHSNPLSTHYWQIIHPPRRKGYTFTSYSGVKVNERRPYGVISLLGLLIVIIRQPCVIDTWTVSAPVLGLFVLVTTGYGKYKSNSLNYMCIIAIEINLSCFTEIGLQFEIYNRLVNYLLIRVDLWPNVIDLVQKRNNRSDSMAQTIRLYDSPVFVESHAMWKKFPELVIYAE